MGKEYLGINLGSDNTIIYSSKTDSIVFSEPTRIAIDKLSHSVKEIGFMANKIQGKTPFNYEVINPVVNGLIYDDDAAYEFLNQIFKRFKLDKHNRYSSLIFTAPSLCGKVNRKVLIDLGKKFFSKEIYIESEAKIAALGVGENVYSPTATLICDIGAGVSDIALLSMGEIVASDSTNIAGNTFDEAIRRYMLQNQHLSIGLKSAEYIKMRLGSIAEVSENRLLEVKGRDTVTSLPSSVIISSGEIKSALVPLASYIALKISDVICRVSPELVSDLTKNGLILTGGGSLLSGMKEYLKKTLSMPVRIADKPMEATGDGFRAFIKYLNRQNEIK